MILRTRGSYLVLIPLAFILVLSMQCSDDSVAPDPDQSLQFSVSKTIDQNGGEVRLGDEAWVIIPAGALDSALVITVARILYPQNPPPNYVSQGFTYGFTPHRYPFNLPVTIGITYDSDAVDPSMMRLDDDDDTSWESVDGADCVEGIATCSSNTFSILSVTSFLPLEEVYVSIDSQGPSAAGTMDDPLPSIGDGIEASLAAGAPYPPVKVAAGIYEERVIFAEGVSIQGGLDGKNWEYSPEPVSHSIVDPGTLPAIAIGITDSTSITGLALVARDASVASASSVALHVVNCGDGLRFVNCRLMAGNGAEGSPGVSGTKGVDGGKGGDAGDDQPQAHWEGGYGGSGPLAGGAGGDGCIGIPGFPGWAGGGDLCGGLGGSGAVIPSVALPGANGGWGANGPNGTKGTSDGVAEIGGWSPSYGGNGGTGAPGCGGGGGGGGSHLTQVAKGGGGGGGGGYGGNPGTGGSGGGSSFAVYLWESSPVFVNCEFFTGDGGKGGKGGDGGARGLGGDFGVSYGGTWSECGARGGYGGHGGLGGSGGGGGGGNSFCVYRVGIACQDADFSACNVWDFHPGQPGRGGEGGQASDDISVGVQAFRGDDGKSGLIGPE